MGVVTGRSPSRGEVFLVALNPTMGHAKMGRESRKTRPCVIVSPDDLNANMGTFIVAPMTTGSHDYPFRVPCHFQGKDGHIVIDQLRTVDSARIAKRLGRLELQTFSVVLDVLQRMFAP